MNTLIHWIKKIVQSNSIALKIVFFIYKFLSTLYGFFFYFIWLFIPIRNNRIVFCNMKGSRYGDNPMYISEAIHKKHPDYEIVWLLNKSIDWSLPNYITRKKYGYISNALLLSSAKVWVDSNTKDVGVKKRKNQLFIQTWHGSYGIKKVALDRKSKLAPLDNILFHHNAKLADVMVSNSARTTEIFRRAFVFSNEVLEVGSPRNDVFLQDETSIINKVNEYFGIGDAKIALYAPTYRDSLSTDFLNIDFKRILKYLNDRNGQDWYILLRLHPQNLNEAKNIVCDTNILNASEYSVMQELLVAADILISDYSSCMFDFITRPKPCFVYAPDLDEYERDTGNYFKLSDLPFPLATTNDELLANIENFDMSKYMQKVNELHRQVGLNETGRASEIVADYIVNFIEGAKRT